MKNCFFGQQILLAENGVKVTAQNKFGPAYWYHLRLVTKNINKVIDLMKNSVSIRGMNYYEQQVWGMNYYEERKNTSMTSGQNSLLVLLVEQ